MLRARQIGLYSITDELDSTCPGGEQLFTAIAATAQLQPAAGIHRGRRAPRSGARNGERPRLLDEQAHAAVRAMYEIGQHTVDQIAAEHGVSRPTVYRSLKRARSRNQV